MESSTLVKSKKTNAMAKGSSSGKMAGSMMASGSAENKAAQASIPTIMASAGREFGKMEKGKSG